MDKRGLFQIGDIAKLFHLSVGTLRHYEKLGLLEPEFIEENGLRIAGDSREITMIDYGLTNDTDKFVTEIQIPVAVQRIGY